MSEVLTTITTDDGSAAVLSTKTETTVTAATYTEAEVDARIAQCTTELAYWQNLKTKF